MFGFLTLKNPQAARVFAAMVEQGTDNAGTALSELQRAAIKTDITDAFRAAFLLIAGFTTAGFFLALTHPLRRI